MNLSMELVKLGKHPFTRSALLTARVQERGFARLLAPLCPSRRERLIVQCRAQECKVATVLDPIRRPQHCTNFLAQCFGSPGKLCALFWSVRPKQNGGNSLQTLGDARLVPHL